MLKRLNNLEISLWFLFERLGELDDLESTISTKHREVDLTPEGHPDMPTWLSGLGALFQKRFERLGGLDDLESAISMQRRVIELTAEGDPNMRIRLSNLGVSLENRFVCLGDLDDLESAISMQRRAVELTPEGHPGMRIRLSNLGYSLKSRFMRLGGLDDLESAISMQRRALDHTSASDPNKPVWLSNLGKYLASRFMRLGELDDLESAISTQRRAIEFTPEGGPNMTIWFDNLGSYLASRFGRLGELDDLNSAISMQRRAVELTPKGHPDMPAGLSNLAFSLHECFEHFKNQQNFDATVECLVAATIQATGIPSTRLQCARSWAGLEDSYRKFGSRRARLRAHSCIVDVLPEMVWLGYKIDRRYRESAEVANLINSAVSAAIDLDDLTQAVEWLEAGRGLIWSQVLSLSTPVDDLVEHYPTLASDLQTLSKHLQHAHLLRLPKAIPLTDSLPGNDTNQHRNLVIKYESCLKQIRACPGFEYFLRPQKLTNLASLVEHIGGPVVFINVSSSHCDALAVSRGGTVALVPLPNLTRDSADKLCAFYNGYLQSNRIEQRGLVPLSVENAGGFLRLLDHLWQWVVRPVLESLGFVNHNHERLPHITWCPTGPLTQLPLHAAGLYPESSPLGPHVYDLVVSSYMPSLAALVRARGDVARQATTPDVLVVTQPATPKLHPLPGTVREGAPLQKLLSEFHIRSKAFNGAQATVESIESVIGQFPWVHFACHGVQDADDPTQSAFALHDGKLTLSTLMRTVAVGAELAFLSACQTATGDRKATEEFAHLAAGMLAVGFKGVVGTMWSIGDADAPIVVEEYYKKVLELRRTGAVAEGSTGAAYALHEAVKCLRERVGEKYFLRWAPFVHYGV